MQRNMIIYDLDIDNCILSDEEIPVLSSKHLEATPY